VVYPPNNEETIRLKCYCAQTVIKNVLKKSTMHGLGVMLGKEVREGEEGIPCHPLWVYKCRED